MTESFEVSRKESERPTIRVVGDGVLLVDKPAGPSSFQVVRRVRRILGAARAGHLGTLDPFATGLLMICMNEGTKLVPFLLNDKREYEGVIKLGTETNTFDGTGTVVRTGEVPPLDDRMLRLIEEKFSGEIWQKPPMFSALKRNGVPLYRLARRGVDVEREMRRITIEDFHIAATARDELFFRLVCSRGAYLRSLASEVGEAIGSGAYLKSLRRLGCGAFRVENSVEIEAVEERWKAGSLRILPLRDCLQAEETTLAEDPVLRLIRGDHRVLSHIPETGGEGKRLKVLDLSGRLIALLEHRGGGWKIARIFRRL